MKKNKTNTNTSSITKIFLWTFCTMLLYACNNNSIDKNNNSKDTTLPPPPDTTFRYEVWYYGKVYKFDKKGRERFLDSLNIKDSFYRKIE